MPASYRIEKRQQPRARTRKQGRGRPSEWSSSLQKRLVVLRLCGLHLSQILEILGSLNSNVFKPGQRRAQQLLRELLSQDYQQLCPQSRSTARKRAAFLRSMGRYQSSLREQKRRSGSRRIQVSSNALHERAGISSRVVSVRSNRPVVELLDEPSQTRLRDSSATLDRSRRSSRIRSILGRVSLSSSLMSDWMSIIRKNFSLSTLAISDRNSSLIVPDEGHETLRTGIDVSAVLDTHQSSMKRANADLIRTCCSQNPGCFHRLLTDLPRPLPFNGLSWNVFMRIAELELVDYETLLFAARTGTRADIIIALLQQCHSGVERKINEDGQNFLFFLDPAGLLGKQCCCYTDSHYTTYHWTGHSSMFECLVRQLELHSFDFDQIDHDGRSFLSYLCTMPDFDIAWLVNLATRNEAWKQRIKTFAHLRDRSGAFLIDYVAAHVRFAELEGNVLSYFDRPPCRLPTSDFPEMTPIKRLELSWYPVRDHTVSEPHCTLSMSNELRERIDLTSYDIHGSTPLMDHLRVAFKERIPQLRVVVITNHLLRGGVNVHARSREGATIMHYAARYVFPDVLKCIMDVGGSINHLDDEGYSPLDYAAETLNKSRSNAYSADLTAQAMRTIVYLLDNGATSTFIPEQTTTRLREVLAEEEHVANDKRNQQSKKIFRNYHFGVPGTYMPKR